MISKNDLESTIEQNVISTANMLEESIDNMLRARARNYGMTGSITFQRNHFSPAVMYELAARYNAAGYKTSYISNQREGDSLQIRLD